MIEVKNLVKRYGSNEVIKGVSFRIEPKERVVLIGPSGSGKSTILRCLNFLETYDSGRIYFEGRLCGYIEKGSRLIRDKESNIARLRAEIGMVFQSFNLFPHMTVLQNVIEAPVTVKKMDRTAATELALALLAKVGLADKANEHPANLSGGQQQRVAIARALAMQPKVVLFDEVTSALDPALTGEVLRVMKQLAEEGTTMVIVTHELEFAREVADRVLFLYGGTILEQGPPSELFERPATRELREFLGGFYQTLESQH